MSLINEECFDRDVLLIKHIYMPFCENKELEKCSLNIYIFLTWCPETGSLQGETSGCDFHVCVDGFSSFALYRRNCENCLTKVQLWCDGLTCFDINFSPFKREVLQIWSCTDKTLVLSSTGLS